MRNRVAVILSPFLPSYCSLATLQWHQRISPFSNPLRAACALSFHTSTLKKEACSPFLRLSLTASL
ncbi:uncharacterized protein METZ01_LOCUS505436, partial [marine metagenome]